MVESGNLLIEGYYAAPDGKKVHGRILVRDGVIAAVGKEVPRSFGTDVKHVLCRDDVTVLPGFIDIHVHARQYALPDDPTPKDRAVHESHLLKEDFGTASRAAINGGVVAFADMPNNPNPPVDRKSYDSKSALLRKEGMLDRFIIDCLTYALLQKQSVPFGSVPYKLYTHDLHQKEIRDIFRALSVPAKLNGRAHYTPIVVAHCENKRVIEKDKSRPAAAETRDIGTILDFSKQFKIPVHIAHVSTGAGLDMIVAARGSGVKVTCETTPTYLFFSSEHRELYHARDNLFMKPPLRSEKDRRRLLKGVFAGEIDVLATDHAPHTLADKAAGAFGIPMLDNYTNFVGWLMQEGVSLESVLRMCCVNPGGFMERFTGERYGVIAPGYVGSFTVVGKKRPEEIMSEPLFTKCGWSPFENTALGHDYLLYAHETVVRGRPLKRQLLYENK
ncbi:amidohydrolase family protein [Candidatus Woesearchaeota archaeon]|nr:amidohydrolase family protein [Candidatus Woesearchaeota archaeon]